MYFRLCLNTFTSSTRTSLSSVHAILLYYNLKPYSVNLFVFCNLHTIDFFPGNDKTQTSIYNLSTVEHVADNVNIMHQHTLHREINKTKFG